MPKWTASIDVPPPSMARGKEHGGERRQDSNCEKSCRSAIESIGEKFDLLLRNLVHLKPPGSGFRY